MRVDQWLPAAHRGDAIGDEAIRIRDTLVRAGISSRIFALDIDEEAAPDVEPFPDRRECDVTIFHFALPSPLTQEFSREKSKRVLVYHNITPPEFFLGYDQELVRIAASGREELKALAGSADLALGDSEFNRAELERSGFGSTGVLPILIDFAPYEECVPDPVLEEMLGDGRANFLFVGRVYPNKRFEDLARLAFFYKKYV
ncbi:MAG TPA: hypothetical protein VIG29_10600, partial [Vicinamibacteria bacterium]